MSCPAPIGAPPVLRGEVGKVYRFPGFVLTESRHRGRVRLGRHTHPLPGGTFVIRGSYREQLGNDDHLCRVGDWLLKPAEAPHTNLYGTEGARCLHVQFVEGERPTLDRALRRATALRRDLAPLGRRLTRELALSDAASALAIEGLLLEFVAGLTRSTASAELPRDWVDGVREVIDARFREPLRFEDLAGDAGADPVRLSQAFRRRFGMSPGTYLRQRRVTWAADQLRTTEVSIGRIALEAGFYDHSHFTRLFRRIVGMTPEGYRQGALGKGFDRRP